MKDHNGTLSAIRDSVHKSLVGYFRTKDFIKALRRCKTPQEEKALVAREGAAIRTALKSATTTPDHRYHSLGKLVVLHLLGHSTLYGQIDFMKLAANVRKSTGLPRLNHKRLGYLGCTMLLDRDQSTLPLICNTIKHDLLTNHADGMIGALAANVLGILAGNPGIGSELLPDILRVLHEGGARGSLSPDLRKRLLAAAGRIVLHDSTACELFVTSTRSSRPVIHSVLEGCLQGDRSEGALMALCQLLLALLRSSRGDTHRIIRDELRSRLLPTLMRVYSSASFSPETDLSRVPNPLLQSSLLQCFCLLGQGDVVASEFIASALLSESASAHRRGDESLCLADVALVLERCGCLLGIEAPAAAQSVAVHQLEELLVGEITDVTIRYWPDPS